jgi:hypothetical protein
LFAFTCSVGLMFFKPFPKITLFRDIKYTLESLSGIIRCLYVVGAAILCYQEGSKDENPVLWRRHSVTRLGKIFVRPIHFLLIPVHLASGCVVVLRLCLCCFALPGTKTLRNKCEELIVREVSRCRSGVLKETEWIGRKRVRSWAFGCMKMRRSALGDH